MIGSNTKVRIYKNYDFYYKDNTIFEGCKIAFFPDNCSHFKEGI